MLWIPAALILAVTVVGIPRPVPTVSLDASWHEALNHALAHRWSAGRDFVFTHGPLGSLQTTLFHPGTFAARLLWGLAYALFTALVFCLAARRLPGWLPPVLFLFLLWFLPVHWPAELVILAATLVILGSGSSMRWFSAVSIAVFAVLSLVKFTFLAAAAIAAPVLVARSWWRHGWRSACALAGLGLAVFLGAAAVAGQSLAALPAYIAYGIELSIGYNAAMSRVQDAPAEMAIAGLVVGLLAVVLLPSAVRRPIRWRELAVAGVVVAFLGLFWKHGFVRHSLHSLAFFSMAVAVPFLMLPGITAPTPRRRAAQVACLVATVGLGLAGLQIVHSGEPVNRPWTRWLAYSYEQSASRAAALMNLREYREHLVEDRAELAAQHALPRVVRAVGSDRIDLIGFFQRVLILNGLNWDPRPVFQGYSAYTPDLARLNRAYFAGSRAPEFLLLDGRTIDGRLPTLDDGPAMLEILRRYEPVLIERDLALLRRRAVPLQAPPARPLSTSTVRFGEWIEIAALGPAAKSITIDVSMSARGKARSLLYKPPEVHIEVDLVAGDSRTYRLIPDMVREPVLIDPLPRNVHEWWRVFGDGTGSRVRRVRVIMDPEHASSFVRELRVRVLPAVVPGP